jgi:hypothetical protein
MLSTVAVEVAQRGVPADRDSIARAVLPRAGENAADLSRPGPHRDSRAR